MAEPVSISRSPCPSVNAARQIVKYIPGKVRVALRPKKGADRAVFDHFPARAPSPLYPQSLRAGLLGANTAGLARQAHQARQYLFISVVYNR